jgi:2-polyprenyl-6-methoxyphenol hydroxylase-like FAD-dependent oxidoreductase/predicted DsbA family dithiol-disulfide isomerase
MKVVIIGSGIAGLTLGTILQNEGWRISINERNDNLSNKGHAFLMHPDAMHVLNVIAKYNPDYEIPGQIIDKIMLKNADDSELQTTELDSWICMKRTAIIDYLVSFIQPQNIKYGRTFSHFIYHNDTAVAAVFTNGEVEYGDVFIGADGAHSNVRNELFGEVSFTPVEVKEVVGVVKNKELVQQFKHRFIKYLCKNRGIAFGAIPCSNDELVWFIQYDVTLEKETLDTPEKLKAHCYRIMEAFPNEVRQVLNSNDFSNNYIWRSTDFDLMPSFSKNNVLLIGDAAHLALPFTSAGTTNALVDAHLMANLLLQRTPLDEVGATFYHQRETLLQEHIQLGRAIKEKFLLGTNAGVVLPLVAKTREKTNTLKKAPIQILYFTDPVCSTCWLVQPQLRKLALQYGQYFEIKYHMGGLLPSWETYNGSKIKHPGDAAQHWKEVGEQYPMPISPDVWLNSPLASSFPPSIAIKAAQLQSKVKAYHFHRRIKEMLFVESKNITDIELLLHVANEVGLNKTVFIDDLSKVAVNKFEDDLNLATQLQVKVLPTFIFTNEHAQEVILKGYQEFNALEKAILDLYPAAVKDERKRDALELFKLFPSLTTFEYAFLMDVSNDQAISELTKLAQQNCVVAKANETGTIWKQVTTANAAS